MCVCVCVCVWVPMCVYEELWDLSVCGCTSMEWMHLWMHCQACVFYYFVSYCGTVCVCVPVLKKPHLHAGHPVGWPSLWRWRCLWPWLWLPSGSRSSGRSSQCAARDSLPTHMQTKYKSGLYLVYLGNILQQGMFAQSPMNRLIKMYQSLAIGEQALAQDSSRWSDKPLEYACIHTHIPHWHKFGNNVLTKVTAWECDLFLFLSTVYIVIVF